MEESILLAPIREMKYMIFSCCIIALISKSVLVHSLINNSIKYVPFRSIVNYNILSVLKTHDGPKQNRDMIDVVCNVTDHGIEVGIGESLVASGYGLYININSNNEAVLPRGSIICKYGKGKFTQTAEGDKTVTYGVYSMYEGVVFKDKLMPLFEVLNEVSFQTKDIRRAFVGYILEYNETTNDIMLQEDPNYEGGRCFVPDSGGSPVPSCDNLGMFANDLAYQGKDTTKDIYEKNNGNNILQLVWEFQWQDSLLQPVSPVLVLSQEVRFINQDPIECGLQYDWGYWEALCNSENSTAISSSSEDSNKKQPCE